MNAPEAQKSDDFCPGGSLPADSCEFPAQESARACALADDGLAGTKLRPALASEFEASSGPEDAGDVRRAMREAMRRVQHLWLDEKNTAPDDEFCAEMVRRMSPAAVCLLLANCAPEFARAVLLRGFSRLWTAGPSVQPSPL